MFTPIHNPEITPQATLEFHSNDESAGSTCALLTPAINAKLRELASGQVLEVCVDDPSAKEDILSWSRLSGNQLLAMVTDDPQRLRFYLQKK